MRKREIITASNELETTLYAEGFSPVSGVDEVGRGPLAGPVMACALILPEGLIIEGVNDSKKMTATRRENLAEEIKKAAISYAFGIIEPAEIDRINILQATLKAMAQAVEGLQIVPKAVLVDGTTPPKLLCERVICVRKGDSASHLIAAASILAKVERDNIMQALHEEFPQYDWQKNKGYGTAVHITAIRQYGISPYHRRSFCKGFL
ncbi:MAG: ribonuclease HII [Defluviitaleaceae bacterium]|nr:ribonuclease HII [Defluviitaleaceae bacterium]